MRAGIFGILAAGILFTAGCRGGTTEKEETGTNSTDTVVAEDFNTRFNHILHALHNQDMNELKPFLSPEFGLLIIRADGALPNILIRKNDEAAYDLALQQLFSRVPSSAALSDETLPRVDCALPDFYTKTGNFMRDTNLLAGSEIWKFGGLSPEDQSLAEKVVQSTTRTVMLVPGLTFFFSFEKNAWYLTLVDMRKPCAA